MIRNLQFIAFVCFFHSLKQNKTVIKINKLCSLLGRAYQITDDILDYVSNAEILGKTSGKDKKDKKLTYVSLLGLDEGLQYGTPF